MSFRPTIAVYIQGRIVDIGYYRNWDEKSLLYEAVAIAALYKGCRTAEEFREKCFGCQTIYYKVEPEVFRNTEDDLKWLEECSEMPIVVDLTARCIYQSYGALTGEELEKIPRYDEEVIGYRTRFRSAPEEIPGYCKSQITPATEFFDMLEYSRIPFEGIDWKEVLPSIRDWPEAGRHLSARVMEKVRESTEYVEKPGKSARTIDNESGADI